MFSRRHGEYYTDYLANPTDAEACDVMRRMRDRRASDRMARLQPRVVGSLVLAAMLSLALGIFVSEQSWDYRGVYDLLGVIGFIVLVLLAACCWRWDWIGEMGVEEIQRRFWQLKKNGAIVAVPAVIKSRLDERLKGDGTKDFFDRCYQATSDDFDVIKAIAEAEAKGTVDDTTRAWIDTYLNTIVARVLVAYENEQAEQNGKVEGAVEQYRKQIEEG